MSTPLEIERKFVIAALDPTAAPLAGAPRTRIEQTYLVTGDGSEERVRARAGDGGIAYTHTVKRSVSPGVREEHEREVGVEEFGELLRRADPARRTVAKTRWELAHGDRVWEVDGFDAPAGLWLAEVELADTGELAADVDPPAGVTVLREVTGDSRFANASLAAQPPA